MRAEALAGLGFDFQPLVLQPTRGRSAERDLPQPGGSGGGPRSRSCGRASTSAGPPRAVAFNLKQRRPGPAYNSPEVSENGSGSTASGGNAATATASTADSALASAPRPAGLARLKLASLRRRVAVPHAAEAAFESPRPPSPAADTADETVSADDSAAQPAGLAATEQQQQAVLLRSMEATLASGSSQALLELPLAVPSPEHMRRGSPGLHPPPAPDPSAVLAPAPAAAEAGSPRVAASAEPHSFQIAAYRPEADDDSAAPDVRCQQPASMLADAGPAEPPHLPRCPATLQAALSCLGLLALPSSDEACEGGAAASDSGSPQLREQLAAVHRVLAAQQQQAAAAELLPLVRRLRQVVLHLAFHQANVQRARSRSPRRTGSSAPPPGPWLSGRSSAGDSKHRSSRVGSPGSQLTPRPKITQPSAEASELQAQLLASLRRKLLLKLGLAALRQCVAAANLRGRLLERVSARLAADTCRAALASWRALAVPSPQQEAAAQRLGRQFEQRRQRAALAEWRRWAARSSWRRAQLACGQAALRRRLLTAGMQHWRCYCQRLLVRRLQHALAARWLAAWSRRCAFAAWRRSAGRSALLKAALAGHPPGHGAEQGGGGQRAPPLSVLEALAATADAFAPVKAFVREAAQQLEQLRQGLRFAGYAGSPAADERGGGQRWGKQHGAPAPLGSVEALLELVPHSPSRAPARLAIAVAPVAPLAFAASDVDAGAAAEQAAGHHSHSACDAARVPAPDPGSPTGYNPACYSSPARHVTGRREAVAAQPGRVRRLAASPAEAPPALGAELLECRERVQQLQAQLTAVEQESEELQRVSGELEQQLEAAQQEVCECRQACAVAEDSERAAAAAVQAAAAQHATTAAECGAQERQLRQHKEDVAAADAAAAGARAALNAATELQALSGMGVQRWSTAVEAIAKELSGCHRSQQAPAAVRLKEARQRLEQHRRDEAAACAQLPALRTAAAEAERLVERARLTVLDAEQCVVDGAVLHGRVQQALNAAVGRHEAAAVSAVAAAQRLCAAQQRQQLLAAQQQAAAGRLRQAAQLALGKQAESAQLRARVQQLQQRHHDAVAAALASAPRQPQQLRRGALKRRLQAVQVAEQHGAGPDVSSPTPVQQWRPPPAPAGAAADHPPAAALPVLPSAALDGLGANSPAVAAAAAGLMALWVPPADWSCSSSELGSPTDSAPAPPLTVDEAAARFYLRSLLRRSLHVLRSEAVAMRAALLAVADAWRRRQLSAALRAWHLHALQAADRLAAASSTLRRRSLLRQWQRAAAVQRWARDADTAADGHARRRLLSAHLTAWLQQAAHERWRDGVHATVVRLRLQGMLRGWRAWTWRRRQKAACADAAAAVHGRRLLEAALRQWHWAWHGKALLHRVFSTAAELWREEVGAALHANNYGRVVAAWRAWQLAVLAAQERRRQATLAYAAESHRARARLAAGLAAFRRAVADARGARRWARVAARALAGWRHLAAASARHREYEAARDHRRAVMRRLALHAWCAAAEGTAAQLARFWLCWQVQAPLRQAVRAWQAAVAARHERQAVGGVSAACSRSSRGGSPQQGLRRPAAASAAADRASRCGGLTATVVVTQSPAQQEQAPRTASASACDWRAAADFWRQRHHTYTAPDGGRVLAVRVQPHTAAVLADVRAQ